MPTRIRQRGFPIGNVRFDLIVALLASWFVIGLYLDGWAHNHGRVDETFFTPYHAVLYSGYAAVGAFLIIAHFRNVNRGYAWLRALPKGYMLSLVGVVIFGIAGAADMLWHEAFGFEEDLEQLLSPSHLALASGAFLFLTGPVRATWRRSRASGWGDLLPVLLALSIIMSLLTFFIQYASPFDNATNLIGFRPGRAWIVDHVGITSAMMYTGILIATLLFTMRRFRLPFGAVTFMVSINVGLMYWLHSYDDSEYLLLLALGPIVGLIGDALIYFTRPSSKNTIALRVFGFAMPFVFMLTYMLLTAQIGVNLWNRGLWWEIHMWLGVPFSAGIGGLFLSYLLVAPQIEMDDDTES